MLRCAGQLNVRELALPGAGHADNRLARRPDGPGSYEPKVV